MQASSLLAFLSFVAVSLAITVTSPGEGTMWLSTGTNTVTWTSVSTDPTSFAVTLVQQGVYKETLADNVSTSKGSLVITQTLPTGSAFQINLVQSQQNVNSILAQSPQFNITQGSSSAPSATSAVVATTAAATGLSTSTTTGDIPNASKSSSASASQEYHSGLMGILALVGVMFI